MRLFAALLIAMPVAASAETTAPSDGSMMLIDPRSGKPAEVIRLPANAALVSCGPRTTAATDGSAPEMRVPEARTSTLADLPNAARIAAVLRTVGPCPTPVVFERSVGSRPDLPQPSVAGEVQNHAIPGQYSK